MSSLDVEHVRSVNTYVYIVSAVSRDVWLRCAERIDCKGKSTILVVLAAVLSCVSWGRWADYLIFMPQFPSTHCEDHYKDSICARYR